MKLKKKIKEKWLNALRSGAYKQSREMLRRKGGGFCCLGVLCDITKNMSDKWEVTPHFKYVYFVHEREHYKSNVPLDILQKVGLRRTEEQALIELNDVRKYNFKKIADYIEANL